MRNQSSGVHALLLRTAFAPALGCLFAIAWAAPAAADNQPTLTVTSPAAYALASPDLRVSATCVDDGPTCRITVRTRIRDWTPAAPPLFGPLLATGIGSIDTIVTPPGGHAELEISATDSVNPAVSVYLPIAVQSSPGLQPVASFSGRILDITPDRALIVEDVALPDVVRIVDRATNTSEIIWTGGSSHIFEKAIRGVLTPSGAMLVTRQFQTLEFPGPYFIREWRAGTLTQLSGGPAPILEVAGNWAAYIEWAGMGANLTLRNLLTGTNTFITNQFDFSTDYGHFDVGSNGHVFYTALPSNELFKFEPGPPSATTQVTFATPARSSIPVTDGVNVVFTRAPQSSPSPSSTILRTADGTEIVLAAESAGAYAVVNGRVAFSRRGPGGSRQAWLRAPDGTERQLATTIGDNAGIVALSDNGEVIFQSQSPLFPQYRRYLARPDGTISDIGEPTSQPIQLDGAWHTIAGGHLFALVTDSRTRSILSEGATGTFFTTDVAILNPYNAVVPVTIRYLRENASAIEQTRTLPALSRTTIRENTVAGLEHANVSTVVDAPSASPVVVERLMTWDASGYGGHLGTSVDRPRARWLFAEGAQGFFHTFFLLANSDTSEASVRFTFLIEQGAPVTHTVNVAPGTRKTIAAADIADLINRSFGTVIESNVPIVAERAMYFGDSPAFMGGHGSAGAAEPAHTWFHAEGATGSLFDTFILLVNPHPVDVPVKVIYTTDAGVTIERPRTLAASSRLTINIEDEAPELANVAVSTRVSSSSYPIVSERAMYWDTTGTGWREAHNSFGITTTGTKWGLAEGRSGGPRGYQTFVLVSNTSGDNADLRVTFVKEDGASLVRTFGVGASQRFNIDTSGISELANSNFSTIVESINSTPISVESAVYWSVNGVTWEGGGNTVATRLP